MPVVDGAYLGKDKRAKSSNGVRRIERGSAGSVAPNSQKQKNGSACFVYVRVLFFPYKWCNDDATQCNPDADIFFSFRRANTASRRIWSVKGWISRPTGFLQSRTPPVHSLHSGVCLQAVFIESLHLLAPPFHDGGIDSLHHLSGHFIRMKSVGWSRSFDSVS